MGGRKLSTHCDLGQRWPLDRCPTRVNPEVKKTYEVRTEKERSKNIDFNHKPKQHTYSFNQLYIDLNIGKTQLYTFVHKMYPGRSTIDLSNDEVEKLIKYIKSYRPEKSLRQYAAELNMAPENLLYRCRITYPEKMPGELNQAEIDHVLEVIKNLPKRKKSLTKGKVKPIINRGVKSGKPKD